MRILAKTLKGSVKPGAKYYKRIPTGRNKWRYFYHKNEYTKYLREKGQVFSPKRSPVGSPEAKGKIRILTTKPPARQRRILGVGSPKQVLATLYYGYAGKLESKLPKGSELYATVREALVSHEKYVSIRLKRDRYSYDSKKKAYILKEDIYFGQKIET